MKENNHLIPIDVLYNTTANVFKEKKREWKKENKDGDEKNNLFIIWVFF